MMITIQNKKNSGKGPVELGGASTRYPTDPKLWCVKCFGAELEVCNSLLLKLQYTIFVSLDCIFL